MLWNYFACSDFKEYSLMMPWGLFQTSWFICNILGSVLPWDRKKKFGWTIISNNVTFYNLSQFAWESNPLAWDHQSCWKRQQMVCEFHDWLMTDLIHVLYSNLKLFDCKGIPGMADPIFTLARCASESYQTPCLNNVSHCKVKYGLQHSATK